MENKELIFSLAKKILDDNVNACEPDCGLDHKHYFEEICENDCDEDHEHYYGDEDFHSMFGGQAAYWSSETPSSGEIIKSGIHILIMLGLTTASIVVSATQPLTAGISYMLVCLLINIFFYGNRIKEWSSNFLMTVINGVGLVFTVLSMIASLFVLLLKVFNG